jgi:outer membrane immunogenic protein
MKKFLLITGISIGSSFWMQAMAADLPTQVYKAAPKVAGFSWSGCYLGVQGGYGWGHSNNDAGSLANRIADETPADFGGSPSGGIAGAQLGCNYQFNGNWVVGLEGEGWRSWMKETASHTGLEDFPVPDVHTLSAQNLWDATLSIRLGAAVGRALFYVKGGGGYGSFQYTFIDAADFHDFDVNSHKFGWIVGAGVEYAITDHWTAKVEYNYLNFGTNRVDTHTIASERFRELSTVPYSFSVNETKNIVKGGFNFKF